MTPARFISEQIRRTRNGARYIQNWPAYLTRRWPQMLGIRGKRPLKLTTRAKEITFTVPPRLLGIFREIFLKDVYALETLFEGLPPNPVIIDVGANVGLFAIAAADIAERPTLIAVEPVPANVEVLRRNLAAVSPAIGTTHCLAAAAVGRATNHVELFLCSPDEHSVVASTFPGFSGKNTQSQRVAAVTLAQVLERYGLQRVDLLKLDCEGAEFEIVAEAPLELLQRVDRMVGEIHESRVPIYTYEGFERTLVDAGFRVRNEKLRGGIRMFWADRR